VSLNVLITGGAGYIGSVMVPSLLSRGYRITVVDRLFFGAHVLPEWEPSLTIVRQDTRRLERSDLEGHDAVIDLAAISNDPAGELDQQLTWDINHRARVRCAELAKAAGVERYVLPSSSSVYGQQPGLLDETATIAPRTAYAAANAAAEREVLALADDHFRSAVVRQATVFGASPRMRMDLALHGMVAQGLRAKEIPVFGDGTQWRPFVHVRDVADAFHLLLQAPPETLGGALMNLGGDELNVTIRELAERTAAIVGADRLTTQGALDDRSHRMDFGRIRERLGFVPSRTIDDGVREVMTGIRDGTIDPDDPRSFTLRWYQHLMEQGVDLGSDGAGAEPPAQPSRS
jgi:nucleoside-diphosphate-sugar epimerase